MSDPITRLNAALEGRYRIERELGEGGMATVYLAEDLRHGRKVALKVLKPELAAVVGGERFLAEIKTTANLQHPHILPLFDSGEADSFLFYVMPYVEGESLRDRLVREKELPVDEAVRIATDVAEALHAAHEQGVIHRDIKPGNILMSKGRPLVADFGIALAVSAAGGGRLTETGLSMGTPYYMSPEQASADRKPSASSDVYSLGCVLYEMLVGEPPYVGSSAQAVLAKILMGAAPTPAAARASVPAHVDAAIRKALQKLPADRFASAQAFATALQDPNFGAMVAVPSGRPSTRRAAAWAALAAGLLIGGVLGGTLRGPRQPVESVTRLSQAVPGGFLRNEPGMLDISRDGRVLAYVEDLQLKFRSFDAPEATVVPSEEGAFSPFFSPDGQWLGYSSNSSVRKVEIASGTVVDIVPGTIGYGATWDPVHGIVYTPALGQTGLWRVSEDGGEPEQLTTVRDSAMEMAHVWPQALPDGRGLLFTVLGPSGGWSDGRIAVLEWGASEHEVILEQETYGLYTSTGHLLSATSTGAIMARRFDLGRLRPEGSAVPVLDGIQVGSFGAGASLAISENGTAAFVRGSAFEESLVLELDRTGRVLRQLLPPGQSAWTSLSPDGRRLALTKRTPNNDDIWIIDLADGSESRFTFQPDEDESPIWSPDGTMIAYSAAFTGLARRVFVRPADASAEPRELFRSDRHLHLEDWSPDGEWLLASHYDPRTELDLLVWPADGSGVPDTVANGPRPEGFSRFSRDGRWIFYEAESEETRRPEIWAVSFPELSNHRQLTTGGGARPTLSADDTEMYYWRGTDFVMSGVSWSNGPRLSEPVLMFDLPPTWESVEVSPDGERIYALRLNPEAPVRSIEVALDWFEELNARVPRQ